MIRITNPSPVLRLLALLALLASPQLVDAQGLSVLEVSPVRHSLVAPVSTAITVTFDRAIDPASISSDSFWAIGRWTGMMSGTPTVTSSGDAVTLVPATPFSGGESVMVILSASVAGLDGTTLGTGGYSFQFWAAAAPATLQFTRIDEFSTRTTPSQTTRTYGGVGCDLNEDGHLDFAAINEDSFDVRVYLNLADGTGLLGPRLDPPTPVGVQASPNEPSDLNRDGHIDLVVVNAISASVSVLLGNGDGTFQPQQEITVGSTPLGVALLDADGDGDIDIANTNTGSGNISLLLNDGNGVFGAPSFFDGAGAGERSLAAADMNEDGIFDLVCGAINSGEIIVLTGNGDGTFTVADETPGVFGTWMLALGDLNGDGHVDVTSADSGSNVGSVLFGAGDGTVGPPTSYPTDPFCIASDVGDMDGDGDLDWVTSSFGGDWALFLNDGNGVFSFDQEFFAPDAASCATMLDLDGDGDLDLALIDELDDLVILERNGAPSTAPEFIRGDANGDGMVDLGDAIAVLGTLFGGGGPPDCPDAHDANDDGGQDISDAVFTLAFLFSSGPAPGAPFPTCGPDPTSDLHDCAVHAACP